jgi:hypothetical protein
VNQEGGRAEDRPILDEEGFQRLLAAAYILQPHNDHVATKSLAAVPKRPFAAGKIIQKRTPSLLVRNSRPPTPWTLTQPIFWKTSEALVIAAIFVVAAVSISRVSPLSARASESAEVTEQGAVYERATAAAKVWGLAQQPVVKLSAGQSSSQLRDGKSKLTAADIIAGYEKDDADLLAPAAEKPATDLAQPQSLPTESKASQSRPLGTTPAKSGGRLAFGRDPDMLAAATVTRYGADAWTYRWQNQKKAPVTSQDYK